MAFEGLSEKLQGALRKMTGRGRLTEQAVKEGMREVRMALLEADVNYAVAKDFIRKVTDRCVGADVLSSLTPSQQVIRIVNEEMTELMGSTNAKLNWSSSVPTIFMLCGLQGAGKTTMCAKLAGYLIKQGKKPMLAACDIYRPAAIKQLQVVGQQVNVPVFEKGTQDPVKTAKEAIEYARYYQRDVLIIDTAGRLHIDENLMDELLRIQKAVSPTEVLLTVDAMTGQDAVNVAKAFDEKLGVTGVILTKLDGDTRGGAALSIKAVTGKPIKFSGIGEKLTDIEPFHPDRMASRILGMGDVLTLIDKATEAFDEQDAGKFARKGLNNKLTLEDFLDQMQSMKKMGGLRSMISMLPGMSGKDIDVDDNAMKKPEAIIRSMTPKERKDPSILNASRRKRIAAGSGTTVQDVNTLIRQFEQAQQMMKRMMGTKGKKALRGMRFPGM
ncbi:signal recognition particle protein [Aristaeella lactis]|uniref:Signal recognition particle subunit FFH/SRP54 (Srp54) n=1 Tax=Aristaeella lactis TaxID=3046383 RepID=A0AC61PI27_9FIRM|nr:signal recognition particle protein [Aristaeella lactis]QUA53643.1 signal recognition particle protein [Aristaeella lactis]SMC37996.1 signal recognition particle subunit FFH/SRP54 (srp54) [Aristaeella lactis]